jgi:hypothetical protein
VSFTAITICIASQRVFVVVVVVVYFVVTRSGNLWIQTRKPYFPEVTFLSTSG